MNKPFQALIVNRQDDALTTEVKSIERDALPHVEEGRVVVRVHYSALNYKDALGLSRAGAILSRYPFIPGCEFVGTIVESDHADFNEGDEVIATGFGIGERHEGGYSEYAIVPANWLIKLPSGLSLRDAMAIGTPGLTAMFAIDELERAGIHPGQEVLVTGATGGVGSFAVLLLHRLGYHVIASTGKADTHYLSTLGAETILPRHELEGPVKPLATQRFDAAIDSVGGTTLANILSQTRYEGAVTACGLVGGTDIPTTIYPFILRGVKLIGIDSVMQPLNRRQHAWERLDELVDRDLLHQMIHEIPLHDVPRQAAAMMRSELSGRTIVRLA